MIDFFTMIGDFLDIAIGTLINTFTSFIMAIEYAFTASGTLSMAVGQMPAFISGCGIAVITLAVIKFLIGR